MLIYVYNAEYSDIGLMSICIRCDNPWDLLFSGTFYFSSFSVKIIFWHFGLQKNDNTPRT
jgi:hypothetical protein